MTSVAHAPVTPQDLVLAFCERAREAGEAGDWEAAWAAACLADEYAGAGSTRTRHRVRRWRVFAIFEAGQA